jgi:hypothetical protein
MEASYFYFIVLPLGIFVFLLTAVAYHYARKEELAQKKWKKLVDEYATKQLGWRDAAKTEDYCEMKLEKALEQISVATNGSSLSGEEENVTEQHCSEEDASCNVT